MSDIYDEILRIKRYREQLAAQALRREQQRYAQQVQAVQQARAEAEAFHADRLREEERRFAAIRNQLVPLERIDAMHRDLAHLREQEALLQQRVLEEQQRLEGLRQALEAARARHAASLRECEKFEQFVAIQRAAEEAEQMRREEQELEEVASASYQTHRQEVF